MPTVSVIIPTYKHRDFVLATLDSVFAQTYTDYEIIVVNDGSPDDTREILRPLAEAGRIHYIMQENQGQGAARNRGLAEAQGEFVALLDDDDLWPPDKLAWQTASLRENPHAGMVVGPADLIDTATGQTMSRMPFLPEITLELLFQGNPIVSPGQTLVRTDLLRRLGGLNAQIWGADDWDLYFRIAKNSRIIMEDHVALFYHVHPNNASNQLKRMLDNACLVIETHLRDVDPKKQRASKRAAYQFLYDYIGGRIISQMWDNVKQGDLGAASASSSLLRRIVRVLACDRASAPTLIRNLVRDTTPRSLRHLFSRLRGRS